MMERKLQEQIAFDYSRYRRSPAATRRAQTDEQAGGRGTSNVNRDDAPVPRRRIVRTPESMVEPARWSERRAQYRQSRGQPAQPAQRSRLVKRTLARTGVPAPVGQQVRHVRSLPRQAVYPSVPDRSGQRTRKGRFWRRLLAFFSLLVLVIVGTSFALTSENFRIRQVNVTGTQNDGLIQRIQHMGIQGQNIFLLNVADLTSRIDSISLVSSVYIEKQLPNQLTINVVERLPVLLWQTPGGVYSVDASGVVIAPANQTTGADHLMTVADMRSTAKQVHPGTHLNQGDIAFALQVLERLPKAAGVNVFKLRYTGSQNGAGSFVIVSAQGWLAYLGSANDSNPLDNRLAELRQILNYAQQNQLTLATIDLRYGLRPVYTLKS